MYYSIDFLHTTGALNCSQNRLCVLCLFKCLYVMFVYTLCVMSLFILGFICHVNELYGGSRITVSYSNKGLVIYYCAMLKNNILITHLEGVKPYKETWGSCGRDRMVFGFTTTYAISAYHH